jgi:hypothetical protein
MRAEANQKQTPFGRRTLMALVAIAACVFGSILLALCLQTAEPAYPRDIAKWQEVAVPPESDRGARMAWFYAANYSNHEWRVFTKDDMPHARLIDESSEKRADQPTFTPAAGEYRGGSSFAVVDDGWLVGFNRGEFGAALYWFSGDGKDNYKISDHQVVDFVSLSNGIHAIEGLAHLGISWGSVIRVSRLNDGAHWEATSVAKLPFAPYAVSVRRDDTMLITLSDSLVSFDTNRKIQTLLHDAPWGGLYPNSSIISTNEQKLYIGMRQFVGEFDLTTKELRLLIPSSHFLNKLPKEDEDRIRKQYGG